MLLLHFADGRSERIVKYISERIYPFIENYIYRKYKSVFDRWKEMPDGNGIEKNCPIFVFWWQGFKQMPKVVIACIDSIKIHSGDHPVHIIDKFNIDEYLVIPDSMREGVKEKRIELPNFSDWVRFSLLAKYGGLWLDASTFVLKEINDWFTPLLKGDVDKEIIRFWTAKNGKEPSWTASMGKWIVSYIAAEKGSRIMGILSEVMEAYFQEHLYAPLYLFMDCILRAEYHNIPDLKKDIDKVPVNSEWVYDLLETINEPYDEFGTCMKKGFYKINWKADMREYKGGELTNYGYLMNGI